MGALHTVESGGREVVESVLRATHLLDCFERGRPEMTLAELTRRGGYSKTTTYRLLNTLTLAGWLERTPVGSFRLTVKAFQVGSVLMDSLDLRREATPVMAALMAETGDTVYLTIPTGVTATCLERIDSGSGLRVMDLDVGGSQPLHLGAAPRALLAFNEAELLPKLLRVGLESRTRYSLTDPAHLLADLASTRDRGYSISREDVTLGVAALGAPIFDAQGRAIAALSLGGLLEQFETGSEAKAAEALLRACRELSVRLGHRQP